MAHDVFGLSAVQIIVRSCGAGAYQVGKLDLQTRAQAMLEGKLNCTDLVQAYMQACPGMLPLNYALLGACIGALLFVLNAVWPHSRSILSMFEFGVTCVVSHD